MFKFLTISEFLLGQSHCAVRPISKGQKGLSQEGKDPSYSCASKRLLIVKFLALLLVALFCCSNKKAFHCIPNDSTLLLHYHFVTYAQSFYGQRFIPRFVCIVTKLALGRFINRQLAQFQLISIFDLSIQKFWSFWSNFGPTKS